MAKVTQKLKSSSGESFAELLIALLISSLALMMLAGMINASANMVSTSRKTLENYYGSTPSVSSGTATIKFTGKLTEWPVNIQIYKEKIGSMEVSFYTPAGGATP